uniref:Uncharacterized protein n=1 Tax=Thermofilum pendens TaxID=2269 RepID=A0A7J3X8Z2_THEPE
MQLSISFTYLQAEKLLENPQGPLNVNLQVTFPTSVERHSDSALVIGFVANVTSSPPAFAAVVKGRLLAQGSSEEVRSLEEKLRTRAPDPELVQLVTNQVLFEVMLLLREIGFPPALPLFTTPPQQPPVQGEFRPV